MLIHNIMWDAGLKAYEIKYMIMSNEVEIYDIYVNENLRRKGIATKLLYDIINKEKFDKIFLEVRQSNLSAISLYEKLGFVKYSTRRNYYLNPTEDAILYLYEKQH